MMGERIEIMDAGMMKQYPDKIRLIEYWAAVMNRPVGWHYWLDIIWILNNIEAIGLPKNAWILDAGAGLGILQYILAARGYNVISLDYAERKVPPVASMIFDIKERVYEIRGKEHPYRKFINYNKPLGASLYEKARKALSHPVKAARFIMRGYIIPNFNVDRWGEIIRSSIQKKPYGKILFARGDFTDLADFDAASVDCIVSVSALEHSDPESIARAVSQFKRVVKNGGSMCITVSAAEDKDWFFEPCRGWCFTENTLRKMFGLENAPSNYGDYQKLFADLKASGEIRKRIARVYFESGDNGLPWGVYEPHYQPVGIVKKSQ